eukprot:1210491-Rhodomonas_salina.2
MPREAGGAQERLRGLGADQRDRAPLQGCAAPDGRREPQCDRRHAHVQSRAEPQCDLRPTLRKAAQGRTDRQYRGCCCGAGLRC